MSQKLWPHTGQQANYQLNLDEVGMVFEAWIVGIQEPESIRQQRAETTMI